MNKVLFAVALDGPRYKTIAVLSMQFREVPMLFFCLRNAVRTNI